MNMNKIYTYQEELQENLTISERLKLIRELSYAMVAPDSVLFTEERTAVNVEQASDFQRKLRDMCDFLNQSLVDKREFDKNYLQDYDYARHYIYHINQLKKEIRELKGEDEDYEW